MTVGSNRRAEAYLDKAASSSFSRMANSLVFLCVLMNFILAIVNAHLSQLNSGVVTGCQVALSFCAVLMIISKFPRMSHQFYLLIGLMILACLFASLVHRKLNPKSIYDMFLIPTFVMLGVSARSFDHRVFNTIFAIVATGAVLEVLFPGAYVWLLNPLDYYRSTREWLYFADQEAANSAASGLYIGAARGGGLVFSFLTDHRVGSVFLEPLSLGYFAVIATLIFNTWYRDRPTRRVVLTLACLTLALLADTRIAVVLVLFAAAASIFERLPNLFVALAPICVIAFGLLMFYLGFGALVSEDTADRMSVSFGSQAGNSLFYVMMGDLNTDALGDSGLLYMIYSAGIVGVPFALYLATGVGSFRWESMRAVPLVAVTYLSAASLFGGAIFSIKTAAILGLFVGVAGQRAVQGRLMRPSGLRPTEKSAPQSS